MADDPEADGVEDYGGYRPCDVHVDLYATWQCDAHLSSLLVVELLTYVWGCQTVNYLTNIRISQYIMTY